MKSTLIVFLLLIQYNFRPSISVDCTITANNDCGDSTVVVNSVPTVTSSTMAIPRTNLRDEVLGVQLVRKGSLYNVGEGALSKLLMKPGEMLNSLIPTRTNIVYSTPSQVYKAPAPLSETVVVRDAPVQPAFILKTTIPNTNVIAHDEQKTIVLNTRDDGSSITNTNSVFQEVPNTVYVKETPYVVYNQPSTSSYIVEPSYTTAVIRDKPSHTIMLTEPSVNVVTTGVTTAPPSQPIYISLGASPPTDSSQKTQMQEPKTQIPSATPGSSAMIVQTIDLPTLLKQLCENGGCPVEQPK